ncbi:polypeptide Pns7 [Wound tumor virus]|uniref:Non-structural protein PNS7 n=1 Tax=Wound tumor virus TaxID=10987 RepID=VP7_WTV|nr:polypeptide Pns7 [Wound tumor virus]P13092.1 RecName: Full=Non-structural protein PNS7 [Wound tumor virus]AAA48507.1 polypeptide Pns7 [Wound tumor virus]
MKISDFCFASANDGSYTLKAFSELNEYKDVVKLVSDEKIGVGFHCYNLGLMNIVEDFSGNLDNESYLTSKVGKRMASELVTAYSKFGSTSSRTLHSSLNLPVVNITSLPTSQAKDLKPNHSLDDKGSMLRTQIHSILTGNGPLTIKRRIDAFYYSASSIFTRHMTSKYANPGSNVPQRFSFIPDCAMNKKPTLFLENRDNELQDSMTIMLMLGQVFSDALTYYLNASILYGILGRIESKVQVDLPAITLESVHVTNNLEISPAAFALIASVWLDKAEILSKLNAIDFIVSPEDNEDRISNLLKLMLPVQSNNITVEKSDTRFSVTHSDGFMRYYMCFSKHEFDYGDHLESFGIPVLRVRLGKPISNELNKPMLVMFKKHESISSINVRYQVRGGSIPKFRTSEFRRDIGMLVANSRFMATDITLILSTFYPFTQETDKLFIEQHIKEIFLDMYPWIDKLTSADAKSEVNISYGNLVLYSYGELVKNSIFIAMMDNCKDARNSFSRADMREIQAFVAAFTQ